MERSDKHEGTRRTMFSASSSLMSLHYSPLGRYQHCGAVTSDGKFHTYGGRFGSSIKRKGKERRLISSSVVRTTINRFDSTSERWHLLPTSGSPPPGCVGVACAMIGSKLYCFGGRNKNKLFNTLSELDLDTMTWKELEPLSPSEGTPMAKMGAAMVSLDDRYLVLYGGYGVPDREVSGAEYIWDPEKQSKTAWTNELHCFDLNTSKFQSKVKPTAALYYCYEEYYVLMIIFITDTLIASMYQLVHIYILHGYDGCPPKKNFLIVLII